jgi:hypothetical protein
LAGLDWRVPDFSTVSRREKDFSVTIGAQPTTTGLHQLVDSTGIKMLGEGEWKTKKHGAGRSVTRSSLMYLSANNILKLLRERETFLCDKAQ